MPYPVIPFQLLICFLLGISFQTKSQSINTDSWRLPVEEAIDSGNDSDIESALESGELYIDQSISLDAGTTRTISMKLPTMSNDGLFIFNIQYPLNDYYLYDTENVSVYLYNSTNSTDGVDGDWSLASEVYITERINDLQKADVAKTYGGNWIRLEFINDKSVNLQLKEMGMYEFHSSGNHNYFLMYGASIMESNNSMSDFNHAVDAHFGDSHGYEPVVFNLAISGTRLFQLKDILEESLSRHPYAQYVLIHSGGNDVTATRPLEYDDLDTYEIEELFTQSLKDVVQIVLDAGKTPIIARLTFRDYKKNEPKVEAGLYQAYGSLPYNWIIDDIVKEMTPEFFDDETDRAYVDFYQLTLNDISMIPYDGVHVTNSTRHQLFEYWVESAFHYLYTGDFSDPTPYQEVIPDLEDSVAEWVSIAQTSMSEEDKWEARLLADQLSDHTLRLSTVAEIEQIGSPLPVDLLYFRGFLDESNNAKLTWETISEVNNDYFLIKSSTDGENWTDLDQVLGAGNSNSSCVYNYKFHVTLPGKMYFSLTQVDHDGKEEELKSIRLRRKSDNIEIFPNPAEGVVHVMSQQPIFWEQASICATDGSCFPVNHYSINEQSLDTKNLNSGIYFLNLPTQERIIVKKLWIR